MKKMNKEEIIKLKEEKKIFKTNINIKDKDLWNWFKFESRNKGFSSVSNYISFLIKVEKENEIIDRVMLKEFEKYYKFISYSYKLISRKLDLDLNIIFKFMNKYNLEIIKLDTILNNYKKNLEHIHEIMYFKDILPIEFKVGRALMKIFRYPNSIRYRDILDIIFDDRNLKIKEIFNYILIFFKEFDIENLKLSKEKDIQNEYNTIFDIIGLFYEHGMEVDEEDLELDLYFNKLKEKNAINCYGIILNLVICYIIKRELIEVRKMVEHGYFYKLEQEEMLRNKLDIYITETLNEKIKGISKYLKNYNLTIPNLIADL